MFITDRTQSATQRKFQGKTFQQVTQGQNVRPGFQNKKRFVGIQLKRPISAPSQGQRQISPGLKLQSPVSVPLLMGPGKGQIDARDMISIKTRIKMSDARTRIIQKRLQKGVFDARSKLKQKGVQQKQFRSSATGQLSAVPQLQPQFQQPVPNFQQQNLSFQQQPLIRFQPQTRPLLPTPNFPQSSVQFQQPSPQFQQPQQFQQTQQFQQPQQFQPMQQMMFQTQTFQQQPFRQQNNTNLVNFRVSFMS